MSQAKGAMVGEPTPVIIEIPVEEKEPIISNGSLKTDSKTHMSPKESFLQKKTERPEKSKKNRETCSICRNGGELILCDRCPKSFHLECLMLKESDIPDGPWYCPACVPKVKNQEKKIKKETLDQEQKRLIKNEKRRLWRLKKKQMLKEQREKNELAAKNQNDISSHGKAEDKNTKTILVNKENNILIDSFFQKKSKCLGKSNEGTKRLTTENSKYSVNITYSFNQSKPNDPQKDIPIGNAPIVNGNQNGNSMESNCKTLEMPLLFPITEEILRNSEGLIDNFRRVIQSKPNLSKLIKYREEDSPKGIKEYQEVTQENIQEKVEEIFSQPNSVQMLSECLKEEGPFNKMTYPSLLKKFWSSYAEKRNPKHPVKYPIEDSELYSYPDLYDITEFNLNKPKGELLKIIPQKDIGDLIQIYDFISTFGKLPKFTLTDLYVVLKGGETEEEKEIILLSEVFCTLLQILLKELGSKDLHSLQNALDEELILVKIIYDNLVSLNHTQRIFLAQTWPELVKIFLFCKTFPHFDDISEELVEKLKGLSVENFSKRLTYEDKIYLLKDLLFNAYGTEVVRERIKADQEKKNEIKKNRRDLEEELRIALQKKKEFERQEKFLQPELKIEQINKRLSTLSEDNMDLSRFQLGKLRKEVEKERDQFKTILKDQNKYESYRLELIEKIEKSQDEIYEIPTMQKKYLGSDGRGFKFFFLPWINDRIFIKAPIKKERNLMEDTSEIKYEWREINTEEEIKNILMRLCDKGQNESILIHNLERVFPKRMTYAPLYSHKKDKEEGMNDFKIHDNDMEIKELLSQRISKYSRGILNIGRPSAQEKSLKEAKTNETEFIELENKILDLEEIITEYLAKDQKAWESFEIRENIKGWVSCIKNVEQLMKLLLMFNERNKNPYKDTQDSKYYKKNKNPKKEENNFSPIDLGTGQLDPFAINPSLTMANKTRLWSKDFENINLEDIFIRYTENVKTFPSAFISTYLFASVCLDLGKRRDIYKKKNEEEGNPVDLIEIDNDDGKDSIEEDNDEDEDYEEENNYHKKLRSSTLVGNKKTNGFYSERNQEKILREWNEKCMYCGEFGDLICCEDCENVTHLDCAGLKTEPNTWRCENCLAKWANRRITRSIANYKN
ncbi:MAG: hypothetical protein MJ252_06625 [archaeon]|nr:hypothetical protein [archaeon]